MSTLHHALAMIRPEVNQGDTADALVFWALVDGLPMRPTSAAVTLYSASGGELVAEAAPTIDAANVGRLALSRTWPADTFPIGEDYAAQWAFVVNGITYSERVFFDVVRNRLPIAVHPRLMTDLQPNLGTHLRAVGLEGNDDDLRVFAIHGHAHMCQRLRKAGWRPSLVSDRRRLVPVALHYALHFANAAISKTPDDLFDKRATTALKLAGELFDGLGRLKVDVDQDGTTGPDERAHSPVQPNWGP